MIRIITNYQFFFRHELLKDLKYYWRVECSFPSTTIYHIRLTTSNRPDISYFCDLDYDPFLLMQDENKVYGLLTKSSTISGFAYSVSQALQCLCMNTKLRYRHCGMQPKVRRQFSYHFPGAESPQEFMKQYPQYVSPGNAMAF